MHQCHRVTALAALLASSAAAAGPAGDLPSYCSADIEARPRPVPPDPRLYELEQVQVLIRHGERVPCGTSFCWPNQNAVPWQCDVNVDMKLAVEGAGEPGAPPFASPPHRVYKKLYDYEEAANELPGNCLLGQLTGLGVSQQQHNGRALRDAYGAALLDGMRPAEAYLHSDDCSARCSPARPCSAR